MKQLTVLIPFVNEREELAATVSDVRRTAGNSVDIIVVDDCSTDGYDYKNDVSQYNVTYILNKENLGSAPTRDLCIDKCETPYFLFLDAHMRFFCNNWVDRITSLLKENDRRLLCGQTLALSKDETGVSISKGHTMMFGAFMPLCYDNIQPDIKWNRLEFDHNSTIQKVPIVLGAAYAGSTRYWKYLHGLEGMQRYGTEEQAISLKVWLEGGSCLLLKDFVVGHIYRKKSIFKRYPDVELFNKLWVVSLLFPPFLKSKSFAIAKSKMPTDFVKANKILNNNRELFLQQKEYYDAIFTKSFKTIIELNKPLFEYKLKNSFQSLSKQIDLVSDYVKNNISPYCGLLNGKMGQIIWLEYYAMYSKYDSFNNLTTELWENITEEINNNTLPWYFATGLTGIGWALFYLYERGFIESLPEDVLLSIDDVITTLDLEKIENTSINVGLGGLFAYLCARCKHKGGICYNKDFADRLLVGAKYLIRNSNNIQELSFAFYYIELYSHEISDYDVSLSLNDVLVTQSSFPENKEYWDNTLSGSVLSSTIMAMIYKKDKYNE